MGGGGGSFPDISPEEYKRFSEESKKKTQNDSFESDISQIISDILSEYNNRDNEAINAHLDKIKGCIEEEFGGTIDLRFGGSIKKHTFIDGLSDVDVLVLVNKNELATLTPKAIREKIKAILEERRFLDVKDVHVGDLAITVTFSDEKEIQLLPAIRSGDGYKISTENGNEWSRIIKPDVFANRLTELNKSCGMKLVPVIKLFKGINSDFPESLRISGYHSESLAIEIFKSYPESLPKTPKIMIKYFFEKARDAIKSYIRDSTKQSIHVDDYLGKENNKIRSKISTAYDTVYRRMRYADETEDESEWMNILGAGI